MSKPLTKALHTRRVVYRLARYLAHRRQLRTDAPSEHVEAIYRTVLWILDNDEPAGGELGAELREAVAQAIAEVSAELDAANACRIVNAPIRAALEARE